MKVKSESEVAQLCQTLHDPMDCSPPGSPSTGFSRQEDWIKMYLYNAIGEGNGTPLQYSCLENPTDGGAWWAAVHGVARSRTPLSDFTFTFQFYALKKEMATHSSVLAWRIPGTWAAVYGVAQSQTRLKRLSSSSSIHNFRPLTKYKHIFKCKL